MREQTKARQKLEKERYVESRKLEAVKQTDKLINELNKYKDIVTIAMNNIVLVQFEDYRTEFTPCEFCYGEPRPIDHSPKLQVVPKESWLDNFFSSRVAKRKKIIESNENETKLVKDDYELRMNQYNIAKKQKYNDWLLEEDRRKEEICQKNQEVDNWEKDFWRCEEDAVLRFIEAGFEKNWLFTDTIKAIESGYMEHSKKVIIELHVKSKKDLFPFEAYKYFKTRDSIEPVKMKVAHSNQRIKELMLYIALATLYIIFGTVNAEKAIVNEVIVNVFHEGVCCISGDVGYEQFNKLDLKVPSNYDALLDNYMRVMKQLARGVKAFERIYVQLGLE